VLGIKHQKMGVGSGGDEENEEDEEEKSSQRLNNLANLSNLPTPHSLNNRKSNGKTSTIRSTFSLYSSSQRFNNFLYKRQT
jgi:hypothetical protein